ncbi:hypothetical protein F5880DRAFT_630885 [Lentinula raphanica]|nr:hypothetical protein F5880DRAFT_630885 [Lentinula raphanica]
MYSLLFLSWLVGTISAAVVDGSNVQLVEGGFGLGLYQTEYGLVATTTVPPIQAQLTTGAWTVTPMVTGTLMLVLRPNLQYPLPSGGVETSEGVILVTVAPTVSYGTAISSGTIISSGTNVSSGTTVPSSAGPITGNLSTRGIIGVTLGLSATGMIALGLKWMLYRSRAAKESKHSEEDRHAPVNTTSRRHRTTRTNINATTPVPYMLKPALPRESTILPYNHTPDIHEVPSATSNVPIDSVEPSSPVPIGVVVTERQTRLLEEAQSTRDALSILERQLPDTAATALHAEGDSAVSALQARVAEMMNRVARLEAQMSTDWARGLTDEPPPGI